MRPSFHQLKLVAIMLGNLSSHCLVDLEDLVAFLVQDVQIPLTDVSLEPGGEVQGGFSEPTVAGMAQAQAI
jgi:hypothetical protein